MVTVIVPFYNAETTLQQTLASLSEQTFEEWKLILVDDGSIDSSFSIATNFLNQYLGKVKIIKTLKQASGPSIGRNEALKIVESDYVIFLDSDDLLAPFCLEQRVSLMQQSSYLDCAVFNQYLCKVGVKSPIGLFNRPVITRDEAVAYFLKMDAPWQTMAPIWKTESLLKLGGFDENLRAMEDPDLHLRALLDQELKIEIFDKLPADCYYFLRNKNDDEIENFYAESIEARFQYLKKLVKILPAIVSTKTLTSYKKILRTGYFTFIRVFLLPYVKRYDKEFREVTLILRESKTLSAMDVFLIEVCRLLFTSNTIIIRKLKLRGVFHKFMNFYH